MYETKYLCSITIIDKNSRYYSSVAYTYVYTIYIGLCLGGKWENRPGQKIFRRFLMYRL